MARKKKSQTDKTDAPESAAGDVTPSSAGSQDAAQDTAQAGNAPLPDDTPGADSVGAAEDTAADGQSPDSDAAPPPDTTETSGDAQATDTPPADDATQDVPETEDGAGAGAGVVEDHAGGKTMTAGTEPPREPGTDEETEIAPPPETPAAGPGEDTAPIVRTEQVTVRQGGFWPLLIGGIAAAGIGVAAAPYIHPYLPGDDPVATADDGLASRVDAQAQRISDLGARLDGLPLPPDRGEEIAALKDEIGGLGETLTDLTERVANLEVQVSNLAVRPAPETEDTSATDAALDELRERLAAQSTEIEDLRATMEAEEQAARDSARATLQRAALTRVMTALDTGEDFSAALNDLRDTGATVPDALAGVAETGVPTRADLIERFPDAARAALAVGRDTGTGGGASVGSFLRAQLGVRSLEPREGDDTDAILSRAEAALAEGRLGDALAEIGTLPEQARAATSGWAADAATRRDALAAAEALSAELN